MTTKPLFRPGMFASWLRQPLGKDSRELLPCQLSALLTLGYHMQTGNKGRFLSLDFDVAEFGGKGAKERLKRYRKFVYEKAGLAGLIKKRAKNFELGKVDRFLLRTRYFTDSGIIGSRAFVSKLYITFRDHYGSSREKAPKPIKGLEEIYSLKRLSESI
jgi:putative transposase